MAFTNNLNEEACVVVDVNSKEEVDNLNMEAPTLLSPQITLASPLV